MTPDQTDLQEHHLGNEAERPAEKVEHEDSHDLDLENAIGNAFKQFAFLEPKSNSQPLAEHAEGENLEALVGNVFLSLQEAGPIDENTEASHERHYDETKPDENVQYEDNKHYDDNERYEDNEQYQEAEFRNEHPEVEFKNEHQEEFKHEPDPDTSLDLEAAVSGALQSLSEHHEGHASEHPLPPTHYEERTDQNHPNHETEERENYPTESGQRDNYPNETEQRENYPDHATEQREDEMDLEAAIGDAFKNLGNIDNHEPVPDMSTTNAEDNKLEDAIGEAFKAITNDHAESLVQHASDSRKIDDSLHTAISTSLASFIEDQNREAPRAKEGELVLDLAGIVQNVVQRMAETNEAPPSSSDASASDRHGHTEYEEKRKEIPSLDDSVLAHFQLQANNDNRGEGSPKSGVPAMDNAARDETRHLQSHGDEREQDLDKLQMNEILQNAFSMAMQDSLELLADMDEGDDAKPAAGRTMSTAAAIAALSVKDYLNKREGPSEKEADTESSKKPLSIAETLALHRASMANAPRRDYSAIQTLEDSMKQDSLNASNVHPQLSNILSSLSQHIQSGNQSQNLMLVIRQMTNALMLNKTSPVRVSSTVESLLKEVNDDPENKDFFLTSLRKAKSFISASVTSELQISSLAVIDTVLGLFSKDRDDIIDPSIADQGLDGTPAAPEVSDCFGHAFSILSEFSNSRSKSAVPEVKPELDSSEHKEKVRVGNRERKKRWREENAERNKDNDLRSRVIKRANLKYGESSSDEKAAWIEEEFSKRKEKRLAKQKKEDSLQTRALQDSPIDTKLAASSYSQDPKLVKWLTDFFYLVAECGSEEDPEAVLTATSAASAVAASSYAVSVGSTDIKPVQSAMSQILNSVLDSSIRSGSYRRIPFLTKRIGPSVLASSADGKYQLDRFSSLSNATNLTLDPRAALGLLMSSQKRPGAGENGGDSKKLKMNDENGFIKQEGQLQARAQSEFDQLKGSISSTTPSTIWNSVTNLKMPQYRKPLVPGLSSETMNDAEAETFIHPVPKIYSPFISNKVGTSTEASSTVQEGLRKPGSFRRPAFSKSKNRTLGFPTLYSASFAPK